MKNYRLLFFAFICLSCLSYAKAQVNTGSRNNLAEGFKNPPPEALPKVYWWWINGNVNPVRLKEELSAMKKAGIAGVDIFDIGKRIDQNPNNIMPAGSPFMSDESVKMLKFAIDEAGKLGMGVNLSLSSSWNAGGNWVKPETAAKTLYYSKVLLSGSKKQKLDIPFPVITPDKKGNPRKIAYTAAHKPVYYEEVAVLAIPAEQKDLDTSKIINVTSYFDKDKELLDWEAPAGEWEIHRYVCANSGEQLSIPSDSSNGPIIDHFDSTATRTHLMYFIERLKPATGDFKNSALKSLYLASYEAAEFTWTPTLPATFKKMNGYDLYKFLPVMFNKASFKTEILENFQFDFKKTLSEMMINNHYGKAKEICNQYGLTLVSESGGPGGWHSIPVETLKALGSLDIPRGEFWNRYEVHDKGDSIDVKFLVKEIAAASHIYKKKLVEQEAFTSYQHWQEGPLDLKPLADRAFCEGMNRLVIHGFSHEPVAGRVPGIAFFAGTHYDDRNVWWPKIRPFNEYLGRISYVLQQSAFVSDVLYYNGDGVPNLVPPKNTRFKVAPGYEYEITNTEILLNELTVENNELTIPGVGRYKLLYVGENDEINPLVMEKLAKLADAGAIIIGRKPIRASGLRDRENGDKRIRELSGRIWLSASANQFKAGVRKKGIIYAGITPGEVLKQIGVLPDFSYVDEQRSLLDYTHYKTGDLDFYLVRNTTDKWISRYCNFRQQSKSPEIWDPVTGNIYPAKMYNEEGNKVKMLVTLGPHETYFVVFGKKSALPGYTLATNSNEQAPMIRYNKDGFEFLSQGTFNLQMSGKSLQVKNDPQQTTLDGAWKITFPKGWGAPDSVSFPGLMSWTKSGTDGIKYFSGTATYHKDFKFSRDKSFSKDNRVYLDLGTLKEVGEAWLNDRPLGITWSQPHRIDITDHVRNGMNTLRVEVANTWLNRLIGDAKNNEKFTKTNLTKGNANILLNDHFIPNNVEVPFAELTVTEAGLLGPVSIQVLKTIR